jgi:hypothetical protein
MRMEWKQHSRVQVIRKNDGGIGDHSLPGVIKQLSSVGDWLWDQNSPKMWCYVWICECRRVEGMEHKGFLFMLGGRGSSIFNLAVGSGGRWWIPARLSAILALLPHNAFFFFFLSGRSEDGPSGKYRVVHSTFTYTFNDLSGKREHLGEREKEKE